MVIDEGITTSVRAVLLASTAADAGEVVTIDSTVHYGCADPFVVRLCFGGRAPEAVVWVFDRGMLSEGLRRAVGDGDVRLWPSPDGASVHLELDVPSGHALIAISAATLARFLRRTFDLVPAGTESDLLDLDAELAALIEDSTSH